MWHYLSMPIAMPMLQLLLLVRSFSVCNASKSRAKFNRKQITETTSKAKIATKIFYSERWKWCFTTILAQHISIDIISGWSFHSAAKCDGCEWGSDWGHDLKTMMKFNLNSLHRLFVLSHLIDKSNKLCESTRCMCTCIWICVFISNVMLYEMIRNANLLASFQCLAWYIRGPWINWKQFAISYFYLSVCVFFLLINRPICGL